MRRHDAAMFGVRRHDAALHSLNPPTSRNRGCALQNCFIYATEVAHSIAALFGVRRHDAATFGVRRHDAALRNRGCALQNCFIYGVRRHDAAMFGVRRHDAALRGLRTPNASQNYTRYAAPVITRPLSFISICTGLGRAAPPSSVAMSAWLISSVYICATMARLFSSCAGSLSR